MDRSNFLSYSLLIVLTSIFIFHFYGTVLIAPNDYLFSDTGDALKNYYTYAHHIKNDSSYLYFEGMNYPYGEHFLYTDCHPIVSIAVKWASGLFPWIVDYSIGIINLLLILSFLVTTIILHQLLLRFRINPYFASLGAIAIMILSPQVFRLSGHLSLSYSFFIPLTLYLSYKAFHSDIKLKWILIQSVNILFWFSIHAYLGMMAAAFLFSFLLIQLTFDFKNQIRKPSYWLSLFLWVLLPVLVFKILLFFTDIHPDRTKNPSGFYLHNAEPDDIILPHHPPLRPVFDKLFFIDQEWEAWSYIGFVSVIVLLVVIVKIGLSLFFRNSKKVKKQYEIDPFLKISLWASLVLLLFSFGFPFKILPWLLDYFPLVKQFRATGRFAWFFYFTITIFTFVVIEGYSKRLILSNKKMIAYCLLIFTPLFFIVEGLSYHKEVGSNISRNKNEFRQELIGDNIKQLLEIVPFERFQAILPLPFYYIGSEHLSRPVKPGSAKYSMLISYHTSLPLFSSYLTRTGIAGSKKIVQLVSPDFYDKPIQKDLNPNKSILILVSEEELSKYEKDILDKAELIFESKGLKAYKVSISDFFRNSAPERIEKFESKLDNLIDYKGFLVDDTNTYLYYNNFHDRECEKSFGETGCLTGDKRDNTMIAEFGSGTFDTSITYIASAWMFNGQRDALNFWFRFIIEEYDPVTNTWYSTWCRCDESEVINGDWSLIELPFKVKNSSNHISIKTIGKKIDKVNFYLDDMLIKEIGSDVYRIDKTDGHKTISLFKNNHRIRKI